MRLRPRVVLGFGLASLVAPPVWAQPAADEPSWYVSVGVNEDLESRVLMSVTSDESDLVSRLGATITHSHKGQRLQLNLTGNGGGLFYKNLNELNRFSYAGGLNGAYAASPHLNFTFTDVVTDAYTYDHVVLVENGILLPLVHSLTNRALGGMVWQLSRRTSALVNVRHDWVKFDSAALVSGSRFTGDAELRRQVSASHAFGIQFAFNRYANRDRITYFNTLSGTWTATLGRSFDANASVGAGRLDDSGEPSVQTVVVAVAGLNGHFRRSALGARYHRSVVPAYGLGRNRLVDGVAATYNQELSQKFTLLAIADFATNVDPFNTSVRINSQNHLANLTFAVTHRLSLVAGYTYRSRNATGPSPGIHSHGAHFSFAYGHKW
jgi:hypothetical protein